MEKYPIDICQSLMENIENTPVEERLYLGKWLTKVMEKNQYGLYANRDGSLTGMGMILSGLRECLLFSMKVD